MRRAHHLLRTLLATGACLPAACLPAGALATPTVSLRADLHPEILGHSTTVDFRVQIAPTTELIPPPLTEANVRYPAGLDITLSGLGIDTCSAATLELSGPQACPADSWMGDGRTVAEFPVKHEVFREAAQIAVLRTTEQTGHLALLFYAYEETAVSAQILFTGQLLPARAPFGGLLYIQVPLVASLPEAPYLSVAEIQLVLGPKDLTYYERVNGRVVPYKPAGIRLPGHCPRGGFPFAVELGFLGGNHASNHTTVPCPSGSGQRRQSRPPRLRGSRTSTSAASI
jgi:hypothetical protein